MTPFEKIVGPRVPNGERRTHRSRYIVPSLLMAAAAICLLFSIFQPYWKMTLHAPQYPKGLRIEAHLDRLTGDVAELDGLNHYIGMQSLTTAAQVERRIGRYMIVALSLLVLSAIFIHTRWAAILSIPALLFPALFLLDLQWWLRHHGMNLDPHAPLSGAIKPFVPPVLGRGLIGQFKTIAQVETGFVLAGIASILILAGLYFHRRAYKPLVDRMLRSSSE